MIELVAIICLAIAVRYLLSLFQGEKEKAQDPDTPGVQRGCSVIGAGAVLLAVVVILCAMSLYMYELLEKLGI